MFMRFSGSTGLLYLQDGLLAVFRSALTFQQTDVTHEAEQT